MTLNLAMPALLVVARARSVLGEVLVSCCHSITSWPAIGVPVAAAARASRLEGVAELGCCSVAVMSADPTVAPLVETGDVSVATKGSVTVTSDM